MAQKHTNHQDGVPVETCDYHASIAEPMNLDHFFHNMDNAAAYELCFDKLELPDARNFVVDFGSEEAWCATSLDAKLIKLLLESKRPPTLPARWINFWAGDLQKDIIKTVALHFGLSPRQIGLLCSEPSASATKIHVKSEHGNEGKLSTDFSPGSSKQGTRDSEKALPSPTNLASSDTSLHSLDPQNIKLGQLVDEIWHFCTVDWGKGYILLGFNSLFTAPGISIESGPDKPEGKRVWTCLILCDDGTVISTFENPCPGSKVYPELLKSMKWNVLNIFKHLSKLGQSENEKSLLTVNIRDVKQSSGQMNVGAPPHFASLLLFYLFDDWTTSLNLVAKREHPYGRQLDDLRNALQNRADVSLVKSLHLIGRRLAVLKRIYQSYELIIKRILERQRIKSAEARYKNRVGKISVRDERDEADQFDPTTLVGEALIGAEIESVGVRLSDEAIVRFERLLDRIRLYALSEIEDCLVEKEKLVFMNFNLVTLKESQAVERLTRITILLAKATIMFLPVSLMTAYFSVQIPNFTNGYTVKTFWICFLVVVVLSFIFLLGFGIASDTVEGKVIYRSLTKTAWDQFKVDSKREKRHGES